MNDKLVEHEGTIRKISISEAIEILLRDAGEFMSCKEISDRLDIPYTTILPKLKEMKEEGRVMSKKDMSARVGRKPTIWGIE